MVQSKKEVIIIAGANGSGKTTFAKHLLKSIKYDYLNADEIAKEINPHDLTKVKITAGKKFFKMFSALINKNRNVIIESTLSGKYLIDRIKNIKNKNYNISIFFIFLDSPDECKNRIKQRVLMGGHYVPDEDVCRRYYRGKKTFWNKYRLLVDFWYLIRNSSYNFEEISLGYLDDYQVINNELFKAFLRDMG